MAIELEFSLNTLRCVESEDVFGDELLLVVLADDAPRITLRRNDVDDGERWALGQSLRSRSQVTLLLFDLDTGRHDFLGRVVLDRTPGAHTARFSRGSADYRLTYDARAVVKTIPTIATSLRIELIDVTCARTEDLTGADDFYVSGAVLIGAVAHPVVTRPTPINDTQTQPFGAAERLLFDGPSPEHPLYFGLLALDDDASTDWAANEQSIRDVAHSIRRAVEAAFPEPPSTDDAPSTDGMDEDDTVAAKVIDAVADAVDLLVTLDRPDVVGRLGLELRPEAIEASPVGQVIHWAMALDGAHYVVRLRVTGRRPASDDVV